MVTFFLFLLGLAVGSFINVVADRLFLSDDPKLSRDIIHSHSMCLSCHHRLSWYDLIPLLSFLLLRGRCRYCQKPIPRRCFFMELVTGLLFAFWDQFVLKEELFGNWQQMLLTIYSLTVISVLLIIAVVDFYKYIIPNKFVFTLIALGLIFEPLFGFLGVKHQFFDISQFFFDAGWAVKLLLQGIGINLELGYHQIPIITPYLNSLITALLTTLFFALIVILSRGKGMGMGDVKLSLFMGLFLGWPKIVSAIYLAFIAGAIVSLMAVVFRRKKLKQKIPFGPFLILGLLCSLFWFDQLVRVGQLTFKIFVK